jgi:hypothetical protein
MKIIKSTKFSTILSSVEKISVTNIEIVEKKLKFLRTDSYSYITDIKIIGIDNERIAIGTKLDFTIGGNDISTLSTIIDINTIYDAENYVILNLNFPGQRFHEYNDFLLCVNNSMKIIVNGYQFINFDKIKYREPISYDHDEKYYIENKFIYKSMGGLIGKIKLLSEQEAAKKGNAEMYAQFINKEQLTIAPFPHSKLYVVDNKLSMSALSFYFHLLTTDMENRGRSSMAYNDYITLTMIKHEIIDDKLHAYYIVPKNGDVIYNIDYVTFFEKIMTIDNKDVINYNLMKTWNDNVYLKIVTDKVHLATMESIDLIIRYIFCTQELRKQLANDH